MVTILTQYYILRRVMVIVMVSYDKWISVSWESYGRKSVTRGDLLHDALVDRHDALFLNMFY